MGLQRGTHLESPRHTPPLVSYGDCAFVQRFVSAADVSMKRRKLDPIAPPI